MSFVLALVLAGCATNERTDSATPPAASLAGYDRAVIGKPLEELKPEDIPESYEQVMQAFFPLHAYIFDGAQVAEVELALRQRESQLVRECMARRGWAYTEAQQAPAVVERDMFTTFFGSALADEAVRQTIGYGYFLSRLTGAGEAFEQTPSTLPEESFEDGNACLAEAATTVRRASASWEVYSTVEIPGIDEYYQEMLAGRDATGRCLVEQGFPEDPVEYFMKLDGQHRDENLELRIDAGQLARLAEEERATAEAEWECYRQNGLMPFLIWNLAKETAIVEGYPDVAADMRQDLRRGID
ncbi:MAG: hypothetical protein LBD70_01140 [Bifidobacteriaceae bacterium]|jgi:hypothetical protein|nr:hypothetical protein [Bifidobacteriaceae bacterium]